MGERTFNNYASRLLSVLKAFLQANTRLTSHKSLPSFLLRAAWQMQSGRPVAALARDNNRNRPHRYAGSGPQVRTWPRQSAPKSKWKPTKGPSRHRGDESRPYRTKQPSADAASHLSRQLLYTLRNATLVLEDCVRLNEQLTHEAFQRAGRGRGRSKQPPFSNEINL
ncbi:hypothetical protein GQ44DRAFT_732040 [Phaeosphaeriaceae sp. PMI808]|nr:hypothetical protein GQ44DRAFT_732323 [Phaeosphaeriaceae sp. PMI808]KAH8707009.1 hypothetical protein GQ44DRAFT_732040 [Phaeosphaeriaceae sp. PMI808]